MHKKEFKKVLETHLLPMFTGASLGKAENCDPACQVVAYKHVCALRIKPNKEASYRVDLERSQEFLKEEKNLVECFIDELDKITKQEGDNFKDLMSFLPRRVIAKLLGHSEEGRVTLQNAIQWLESLASQTYEGKQIVAALGITGSINHGPIDIFELSKEDFSKVLSNGFDTIYQCGEDGKIFNIKRLNGTAPDSYAPVRMGAIANWAVHNKVSIVLNRNGEILVFKSQELKFAKRKGVWKFYSHLSALKQFGKFSTGLKNSVYQTCLDASFARSGGCIAMLTRDGERDLRRKKIISRDDIIENKRICRTKLLEKVVGGKSFQSLDRLLRQELMAIDGAIVLDNQGKIITVGAIVKVPGGSTGGGRKAAAINLSKFGLGIKISSDGPITGFKDKDEVFSL